MRKLYSLIMLLAVMVAALGLTACSSDDENGGGGGSSPTSLTVVKSNGDKYTSLGRYEWASEYETNGSLTKEGTIYCLMTKENYVVINYLRINLINGEKSISDFPSGYDLGNPTVNFGTYPSSDNKYKYASGSVKVVSNNGKGFTLKFDNYEAEKTSGSNIVVNGTMYVEKEKLY